MEVVAEEWISEKYDRIGTKKQVAAAIFEVCKHASNPLFIAEVPLYWAEGYKRGAVGSKWKRVDSANSDPKMIELIMRFFREACGVREECFRAQLIARRNIDIDQAARFWSQLTKIPKEKFIKTFVSGEKIGRKLKKMRKSNILPVGTVHIGVYDVTLFFRIIGWVEGLQKKFL